MESIDKLLQDTLEGLHLSHATREARAMLLWPQVVGPAIAAATEPVTVRGGELVVNARSAVWVQELTLSSGTILARLQEALGANVIRRLRVRLGPVTGAPPSPTGPKTSSRANVTLSEEEEQEIAALASVGDPELSAGVARALRAERLARKRALRRGGRVCRACGAVYKGASSECPACEARPSGG